MALPSSGRIKLSDVNTELGLSSTTRITLGQATVRTLTGIASGRIRLAVDGYGKANRVALSYTFSSNTTQTTINPAAVSGYIAGKTDLTITVNSGVYVYSTDTATAGLTISGFSAGDTIALVNNGYIMGMGGYGGDYPLNLASVTSGPGGSGGPALSINYNIALTNNSYIAGGGGGGGSGNSGGGGGAGGGPTRSRSSANSYAIVVGGDPGVVGNQGSSAGAAGGGPGNRFFRMVGSGASGGRILPGTGGAGGTADFSDSVAAGKAGGAGGGGGGFLYTGDLVGDERIAGGAGGSANNVGGAPSLVSGTASGAGGGGGWGAAGASNRTGTYAGGAGGKGIALNGYSVTYAVTGTIYGAVS
jgi:hypothetical protein